MLLVAPALAGLVTAGAPLIHELFPSSLDAAGVTSLREFAALLSAWTLAALLVNFMLPAMFALGRARLVNLLAVPLLLLHIAATAIGSELLGVEGAVAAFWSRPRASARCCSPSAATARGARWPARWAPTRCASSRSPPSPSGSASWWATRSRAGSPPPS